MHFRTYLLRINNSVIPRAYNEKRACNSHLNEKVALIMRLIAPLSLAIGTRDLQCGCGYKRARARPEVDSNAVTMAADSNCLLD